MPQIYDFMALTSRGKELDFSEFKGKVLLTAGTVSMPRALLESETMRPSSIR